MDEILPVSAQVLDHRLHDPLLVCSPYHEVGWNSSRLDITEIEYEKIEIEYEKTSWNAIYIFFCETPATCETPAPKNPANLHLSGEMVAEVQRQFSQVDKQGKTLLTGSKELGL